MSNITTEVTGHTVLYNHRCVCNTMSCVHDLTLTQAVFPCVLVGTTCWNQLHILKLLKYDLNAATKRMSLSLKIHKNTSYTFDLGKKTNNMQTHLCSSLNCYYYNIIQFNKANAHYSLATFYLGTRKRQRNYIFTAVNTKC